MGKILKRAIITLLICMLIVVVLVGAGLLALPYFLSPEKVKHMLQQAVEDNTEYSLVMPGELSYTGFPNFVVELDKASLIKPGARYDLSNTVLKTNVISLLKRSISLNIEGVINGQKMDLDIDIPNALEYSAGQDGATKIIAVNDDAFPVRITMQQPLALSIKATAQRQGGQYNLRDLQADIDTLRITGKVSVKTGKLPALEGDIAVNHINVPELLLTSERVQASLAPRANGTSAPSTPRVNAAAQRHTSDSQATSTPLQQWDNTPLDLSGLRHFNADLAIKTDGITTTEMTLGPTALRFINKAGNAEFVLHESQLYGGTASGKAMLDARNNTLSMQKDMALTGVKLGDFLHDFMGFDRLDAVGDLHVKFSARGNSEAALVRSLQGRGTIATNEGVLKGIDLSALDIKDIKSLVGALNSKGRNTPVLQSSASFTLQQGVLQNSDLSMKLPTMQIGGKGKVDLPAMRVDYTIIPTLTTSSEGWAVPVKIKGPFHAPEIKPDTRALLGTAPVKDGIQKLLNSGEAQNLLGDKLGIDKLEGTQDLKKQLFDKLF